MNIFAEIDTTWTLFLDRDGVINHEKEKEYVLNWSEFRFYEGVKEALRFFAGVFGTIVMVTNQRGIGKGLMTHDDLEDIHTEMLTAINDSSGRINKIYYCSDMDDSCMERKPNPGMAHLAQQDFPGIDFSRSLIVGNKLSDMKFGRNAGMYTVFVATTNPETPFPHPDIDYRFNDLAEVAENIKAALTES
jgi:histidinol-phosphate phosphatase family protein